MKALWKNLAAVKQMMVIRQLFLSSVIDESETSSEKLQTDQPVIHCGKVNIAFYIPALIYLYIYIL